MEDQLTWIAVLGVLTAAASEIIGMSKMKENTVIQVILRVLKLITKNSRKNAER